MHKEIVALNTNMKVYEESLALNNLEWLICHKPQTNQIINI